MDQIPSVNPLANFPAQGVPMSGSGQTGPSFKEVLMDGLNQVNQMQVDADRAVEQLFAGGDVDPAEVLTAVQKADMTFRLMMQVRNKLVQAYQEIRDVRI